MDKLILFAVYFLFLAIRLFLFFMFLYPNMAQESGQYTVATITSLYLMFEFENMENDLYSKK